MNLLNKLTIKNLKLNKKRTIVTIIGIILSVALLTAVSSIYASGIASLIKFETDQKGDYHVAFYDVPTSNLYEFQNMMEVNTLNITQNIGYAKIASKNEYKPYAYIKAFSKNALNNLAIRLVEGRLPEKENEILIPTHLKTNGRLEYKVGDTITLEVGKRISLDGTVLHQNNPLQKEDELLEQIIDTHTKVYTIVGIIERPASSIESYSAPGFTFITYLDDNNLKDNIDIFVKFNKAGVKKIYPITANILGVNPDLFAKYYEGTTTREEILKYINEEMPKEKYQIGINNYLVALETNPIGESGIDGLSIVVVIVIIIIIITSVFCIKNSFDISITEKIKQYGMLRSIGATKKQIKHNVFYEATILGLIGIPLGILSGFLASYILIIVSNYFLNSSLYGSLKLIFKFSYLVAFISLILGIITIYFSAFRSARKASLVSPISSIRNSANIKLNSKKIKTPKLINKLFGIGGVISLKNLKRNKKKYRPTVISIIVSVFVFIALSSFMSMFYDSVENEIKVSEYNLSLTSMDQVNFNKMRETTNFDYIDDFAIITEDNALIRNVKYNPQYIEFWNNHVNEEEYASLYVIGDYAYQKYLKEHHLKYEDMKDKAIILDYIENNNYVNDKLVTKTMQTYNYKKNDIINLTFGNEEVDLEVGFVSDEKPFGLKNINTEIILISDEEFSKYFNYNNLTILYKSSNATKLQDNIDEYLKGYNYSINNLEENTKAMNNLLTLVGIFLYGFIIVISLIGITNIFNTITTNMELRKPEFAMLKSIGMTKKEFNRMISLESLFMGLKSLLIGIPIGLVISYLIYYFLARDNGPFNPPMLAIIIAITCVLLLISWIMKYSINKINKQNTIETIRNENI